MIKLGLFVRVFGVVYAITITGLSVRYFEFMLFVIRNVQTGFVCTRYSMIRLGLFVRAFELITQS